MSKERRIPCPAHVGRNRNCSIWRDDGGRLRAKCWSHGCAEHAILAVLGEAERQAPEPRKTFENAKSSEVARRIWSESGKATGSLVETYFLSRGIRISLPLSLRFHPGVRHLSGRFAPALIAAVEHVRSRNVLVAIHRTWLQPDGSGKANLEPQKAALGPIRGGAVRLSPAAETMCLAEGIETALAILQSTAIPTWATLGTSNLAQVEVPDCTRTVLIAADNDDAGRSGARAAAIRLRSQGRVVGVAYPSSGKDFDDLLRAVE